MKNPRYRALLDKHAQVLTEAVNALLAAPGPFEVEAEGSPGRLILTTRGGTRAEVDLRGVVWGTDGPPVQDAKWT